MAKNFVNISSLKLDEKFVTICERLKCDSSFVKSCFIDKAIDENENILLVLTQNTTGHFQNIGKILGHDMTKLIEKNKMEIINVLQMINELDTCPDYFIKKTFEKIFSVINEFTQNNRRIVIIFEDISQFLDLGMDFKQLFLYLNMFKKITTEKNIRIYISYHSIHTNDETDRLYNLLYHLSDIVLNVSGLKTGISRNVTGSVEFVRPEMWNREIKKDFYHYKLDERSIEIFRPGRDL